MAVLPLDNLSPDPANAYFAAGMHEEILTQLSKISGLGVFARTTMNQYRGTDRSIFEIGRELGAAAVLEGSVRRAGERVRITAQLIDPETQAHLWSESYDRRLDDVFAVQEDIARRVVENLAATLSPSEDARISVRPTESLAAYDLYLRGRGAYFRFDAESNREAARLFEKALDLDPEYALAWAGLGDALAQRDGRFGYPHGETAEAAVRHAQRSIDLNPELAEGYKALGAAQYKLGRREQALAAFQKAVQFDPNNYEAWNGIATVNYNLGRFDESVRTSRNAARLAPNE
ncbi:MAG: tetratricopeptide repeat protein, partial [Gammaproteobacteria bacterium]|nr:tetratricopeptide repeat protein [Gammaproteobacteria bacterium]NIT64552.1 tetratricopeptide repeat protein [Gammaproteobacteria bacterium]NIV21481.1 tetratricopeptide repeat protein [Gammaproteobacteria bacterium]NIY33132.1 tetratricopeptide repeat protein [Gammaproteobacteria bacterium]